jgi:hypothetical protein
MVRASSISEYQWTQSEALDQDSTRATPWEMLLMYWLLMVSGNPFLTRNLDVVITTSTIIPLWYIYKNSNKVISYRTIVIFVFFIGYELMHALMFKLDYSLTIFKIFLVLLFAFSIVNLLKERFVIVLTQTMVIISIVSFVFTLLCYVPGLNRALYNFADKVFHIDQGYKSFVNPTLIIYTFSHEYFTGEFSYARNPGPFWESGAFAAFLLVTLYLHYCTRKISSINNLFDKQSIILITAILSTTSTTGFFTLVVLLFYYTAQTKSALKYVLVVLMGFSFYMTFVSVEFLGKKVAKELEESSTRNNRFGAALMDFEDIMKRPLLGSSRRIEVLFGTTQATAETRRPNGFTNFIRNYGFLYTGIYFIIVFGSFTSVMHYYGKYNKRILAFFGVFLLWMVSFSELLFNLAFFKALIFLSQVYQPKIQDELTLSENQAK